MHRRKHKPQKGFFTKKYMYIYFYIYIYIYVCVHIPVEFR